MTVDEVGEIPGPITAEGPTHVPGEKSLTQSFSGPLEDETYLTRGYDTPSKVGLIIVLLCRWTGSCSSWHADHWPHACSAPPAA